MTRVITDKGSVPIKMWIDGVDIEESAEKQLRNIASLPFIHSHVAAMPDVHWGMGATVGSVIPTLKAIIPAAVGVDIGCGMVAQRTSIRAEHLPDNLHEIRCALEKVIPHGRTDNGGSNDRGAWGSIPEQHLKRHSDTVDYLQSALDGIIEVHPSLYKRQDDYLKQAGTLWHWKSFRVPRVP